MRDFVVMSIVLPWAMVALRHPWVGVLLWVWVSLMNPHRYTWGFAYNAPVAMIAGAATLLGLSFTAAKKSPFRASPTVWFVLLAIWITFSWLLGANPSEQFPQWDKVMKVYLMVLVTLMLFHSKTQIFCLVWVLTLSVALLSAKGGLFTIATAGSYRVWGPPGSWIYGNNEFAVATIMTIPLLRFMQLQVKKKWLSLTLVTMMLLAAASALGSQSRGGFLAIVAMTTLLWWRGQKRIRNGLLLLTLGLLMIAAMPSTWNERMDTIETYEEDASALGRLSAWWVAFRIAQNYPFGVGFSATSPELFERYSPYGSQFGHPVAHSIWFQMMGHHGFVGFFLFLAVWVSTWFVAGKLRKAAAKRPHIKWVGDLGAMAQVCIVGYAVGGSFLQLGYYDFPYYVMAVVCITYAWVRQEAWQTDRPEPGGWRSLIGLADDPRGAPNSAASGGTAPGGTQPNLAGTTVRALVRRESVPAGPSSER
jgi:putative inorganic carbon (hco3(-)) transporter